MLQFLQDFGNARTELNYAPYFLKTARNVPSISPKPFLIMLLISLKLVAVKFGFSSAQEGSSLQNFPFLNHTVLCLGRDVGVQILFDNVKQTF